MAVEPFATVADLEARWRPLTESERATAETLLADATNVIAAQLRDGWEDDEKVTSLLCQVTCALVRRSMATQLSQESLDIPPASNYSETTGSVTRSVTLASPFGTMKLTKDEMRLLGISTQKVGQIYPYVGWGQ